MKIIRVFPERTSMTPDDDMAFIGVKYKGRKRIPQLVMPNRFPDADEVHISCAFTWQKQLSEQLAELWREHYPVVKIGGPAYGNIAHDFMPGVYLKTGVTFTTKGCNKKCPWCLVPEREGKLYEFPEFESGYNIQDNNLLQASSAHLDKVFAMLQTQKASTFGGGLDTTLLTDRIADRLRSIKIKQLFLAADTDGAIKPLRKAIQRLSGLPRDKIRCYVLIGHNGETIEHAEERLRTVYEAGCLPYAMLYQPPIDKKTIWPLEWTRFARLWQRPAAIKGMMK